MYICKYVLHYSVVPSDEGKEKFKKNDDILFYR